MKNVQRPTSNFQRPKIAPVGRWTLDVGGWTLISLALALLWLGSALNCADVRAQEAADPRLVPLPVVRSSSEQFIIYGRRMALPFARPEPTNQNLIALAPEVLAISCERVKQALLSELGLTDDWRAKGLRPGHSGRIQIVLRPKNPGATEPVTVASTYFPEGWQYRIEIPDRVEEIKAVRSIVQALLLELANRRAGTQSADVPMWLTEGLTWKLLTSATSDLMLKTQEPSRTPPVNNGLANSWLVSVRPGVFYQGRTLDPIAVARDRLAGKLPLSFNELSLAEPAKLEGETWVQFQASALLFVHNLLQLPDGRRSLVWFLEKLPAYLNWQLPMLEAFSQQFQSLLDVEKWWALHQVNFVGRNPRHVFEVGTALAKLDEVLHVSNQQSTASNSVPVRGQTTLQTAIDDWDFALQRRNLQRTAMQLQLLVAQSPPELFRLFNDYYQTLTGYLNKRERAGFESTQKGRGYTSVNLLVSDTIKQLNRLDDQRKLAEGKAAKTGE